MNRPRACLIRALCMLQRRGLQSFHGQHLGPIHIDGPSLDMAYGHAGSQRRMSCKGQGKSQEPKLSLVSLKEAQRFMKECFMAACVPDDNAGMMALMLSEADHNGHYSHGMNRLEMYLNDIERKVIDGQAKPKVLKESAATAWVDGCNGLGAVVGIKCMNMAIQKALKSGVSWVAAKNSNHYGMQRFYIMMALEKGLIGLTTTNTSPLMAPTRCREAALGTNPLAFGAPAECDDNFVLDMATTAVAVGKIELQLRKGEPLPSGWALDKEGKPTTDAKKALEAKLLMPLGGEEKNSGYKGTGLSAMVDIMSGVISGAAFSKNIKAWMADTPKPYNLGHSFMALNPEHFAPGFRGRQSEFNCLLRNCKPVDPKKPVLVPGDVEAARLKAIDADGGLRYTDSQIQTCAKLAKKLQVKPLQILKK